MAIDREMLRRYRLHRLQRAAEYTLLFAIHFFFMIAQRGHYRVSLIIAVALVFFGMNLQLTLQRERRRTRARNDRSRVITDMAESILFLLLLIVLSIPGVTSVLFEAGMREHYAIIAAMLCGVFLGALVGEVWFQLRRLPWMEEPAPSNYFANLKRTIILPFEISRAGGRRREKG